jgi:hypothetical protein
MPDTTTEMRNCEIAQAANDEAKQPPFIARLLEVTRQQRNAVHDGLAMAETHLGEQQERLAFLDKRVAQLEHEKAEGLAREAVAGEQLQAALQAIEHLQGAPDGATEP